MKIIEIFKKLSSKQKIGVTVISLLIVIILFPENTPDIKKLPKGATILAFGDSLTEGKGVGSNNSYPSVLKEITGYNVINEGISGEVTQDGLARLPELLDYYKPNLMILCHGGNDMLQRKSKKVQEGNICKMIDEAQKRGIDVILVGVPRPGILLSSDEMYEKIAEQYDIPYEEDVMPDVISSSETKSDKVHPNEAGYRMIAKAIAELIEAAQ